MGRKPATSTGRETPPPGVLGAFMGPERCRGHSGKTPRYVKLLKMRSCGAFFFVDWFAGFSLSVNVHTGKGSIAIPARACSSAIYAETLLTPPPGQDGGRPSSRGLPGAPTLLSVPRDELFTLRLPDTPY